MRHTIACLERPEKSQFTDYISAHGGRLLVLPTSDELHHETAAADIVQLEWWHHPIVAGWLGSSSLPSMRLVVWSHVSGLHPPEIPPAFAATPHRFLFTSPCSWEHPRLSGLDVEIKRRIDAVYSSGGFDDLPPPPERSGSEPLRIGYVGTLNFAKLHPDLLDYVAAARLPNFLLSMVGDPAPATELLAEAATRGLAKHLEIRGYRSDVAAELAGFDVLAYLLNPLHYGTTENALLEAMAMGVVPVVLANPAERALVRHGETGLIVDNPGMFATAIDWLSTHPAERRHLSVNAAREVRERFAIGRTADRLLKHYRAVLDEDKRRFDFRPIFGGTPAQWFRACQGDETWRFPDEDKPVEAPRGPHYLYEKTKGSVFHYHDCYPKDVRLAQWARRLAANP